jgi:hypothetical protein
MSVRENGRETNPGLVSLVGPETNPGLVSGIGFYGEKLAKAVAEGAGTVAGVIVGTPVHGANLSTETRRFLDRLGGSRLPALPTRA